MTKVIGLPADQVASRIGLWGDWTGDLNIPGQFDSSRSQMPPNPSLKFILRIHPGDDVHPRFLATVWWVGVLNLHSVSNKPDRSKDPCGFS
jgi:hypothetical protein